MIIISLRDVFKKEEPIPKSLIGNRFTDFAGDRWELTGKNRLNVPYFSKVVKGNVQKKQFTHVSGLDQVKKWKKEDAKLQKSMDQISKDISKSLAKRKKEVAQLKRKNYADRIVVTKAKSRKKPLKTVKIKKFTIGRGNSKIIVSNIKRKKWIEGFRYTMDLTNATKKQNKITNYERFGNNVKDLRKSIKKHWFYSKK